MLLFVFMFFFGSCDCQVNTTDPQISKNIKESQRNGFFVREYAVAYSTDTAIKVEEAWMEKAWFYEIHNGNVVKVARKYCRLCFKVKQTSGLRYKREDIGHWLMEHRKSSQYVGLSHGIYELGSLDCGIQDSISIDLIQRTDNDGDITDTKMGVLIFKVKQVHSVRDKK